MVSRDDRPVISGDSRFRPNPRLARQMLGGKAVVLHYEGRKLLGLNDTGTRIWGLLDGLSSVDEIARVLSAETDVAHDAVLADVHEFLRELVSRGLIVEAGDLAGEPQTDPPSTRVRNASEDTP